MKPGFGRITGRLTSLEEIAWLTDAASSGLADPLAKGGYGAYLRNVLAKGRGNV